jgi:hypothetical protein
VPQLLQVLQVSQQLLWLNSRPHRSRQRCRKPPPQPVSQELQAEQPVLQVLQPVLQPL